MQHDLGRSLGGFDTALARLWRELAEQPALRGHVFAGTEEWRALLAYKLVPHLVGEGCLVVAVTGGTNTGKSTVVNLLAGTEATPVRTTAAATCRPLLIGSPERAAQCLEGKLVPEFTPRRLEDPEDLIRFEGPDNLLYVCENAGLPARIVILDTPDIDSIETRNWEVANHIRAAGDVLVATLTPEKYKDDRVVDFFRRAHAAGRVVLPLLNKANPANGYDAGRQQLAEFIRDVGLDKPACFILPHDYDTAHDFSRPIPALDGMETLREHIERLDTASIKKRVYHDTVARFAGEAAAFLEVVDETARQLKQVEEEFEARARQFALRYDPAPGSAVGGLFHEFVQSKRGPVARSIGRVSSGVARGAAGMGRALRRAVLRRTQLERPFEAEPESELQRRHRESIERISRDLATSFLGSGRNLAGPAAAMVAGRLDAIDLEAAVKRVARETLRCESISDDFRRHAERTLETWWNDHRGKRRVLLALDTILAIMPAAIAVPISIYVGGIGLPETMIVAGPLMEQFIVRVIEYQFGDAMFDFLSPWRDEQRAHLVAALEKHLTEPALAGVRETLASLEGETAAELRGWLEQCRQAL